MESSIAPLRFISSRMMFSTLRSTRRPSGIHVYTPLVWLMSKDWDGDGVKDSDPGVLAGEGPYNRGDPFRHGKGLNCTFADGHTKWLAANAWLQNQDDLWGKDIGR